MTLPQTNAARETGQEQATSSYMAAFEVKAWIKVHALTAQAAMDKACAIADEMSAGGDFSITVETDSEPSEVDT